LPGRSKVPQFSSGIGESFQHNLLPHHPSA
jgi:hypothetical protein